MPYPSRRYRIGLIRPYKHDSRHTHTMEPAKVTSRQHPLLLFTRPSGAPLQLASHRTAQLGAWRFYAHFLPVERFCAGCPSAPSLFKEAWPWASCAVELARRPIVLIVRKPSSRTESPFGEPESDESPSDEPSRGGADGEMDACGWQVFPIE